MSTRAFVVLGLLFISIVAPAQPGHTAGFDCAKAHTPVEKAICADPELSRLDGEMTQKYWAVYAATPAAERS